MCICMRQLCKRESNDSAIHKLTEWVCPKCIHFCKHRIHSHFRLSRADSLSQCTKRKLLTHLLGKQCIRFCLWKLCNCLCISVLRCYLFECNSVALVCRAHILTYRFDIGFDYQFHIKCSLLCYNSNIAHSLSIGKANIRKPKNCKAVSKFALSAHSFWESVYPKCIHFCRHRTMFDFWDYRVNNF